MDPANTFKGWEIGTTSGGPFEIVVWLSNNLSSNGIEVQNNVSLTTGTLYNIVMTYDGSRTAAGVKIYINGVNQTLIVTSNNLSATIANTKPVAIGARVDGSIPLNGIAAYTRIYNRALSSIDVSNYYALGAR
jgi:hypothetical protein